MNKTLIELDNKVIGHLVDCDIDKRKERTILIGLDDGVDLSLSQCELKLKYPLGGNDVVFANIYAIENGFAKAEVELYE